MKLRGKITPMKKFILVLLFFPTLTIAASIQDYLDNTPRWAEEVKEVIYLTTRCSGIMMVTGEHRIVVGDPETGEKLLIVGQQLAMESGLLAINSGISVENIKERTVFWMKKYADDSINNTNNYNNIFVGDYAEDFTFCDALVEVMYQ